MIVTPCTADSPQLRRTVESVCHQRLDASQHTVRYVIKHSGEASDELRKAVERSGDIDIKLMEGPDNNLYDALAQSFQAQSESGWTADWYGWLGAGDYYSPNALDIVARVSQHGPQWITGMICGYNQEGHLIESKLPFAYRQLLLGKPVYGPRLPFVQAESTFWCNALHKRIDWDALAQYKLAGDAYLWKLFSQFSQLNIVEAWLGGFERRPGQLSDTLRKEYLLEQQHLSKPLAWSDYITLGFDRLMWHAPRSWQRRFGDTRFVFDDAAEDYIPWRQS